MPATLVAFGAPPTSARATVVSRSAGVRVVRALVALGGFWGLAVVSVFIPVAHLVLVPGFVVAGATVCVLRLREGRTLARVEGRCPRCAVPQSLAPGGRLVPDRRIVCATCHSSLRLVLGRTEEHA